MMASPKHSNTAARGSPSTKNTDRARRSSGRFARKRSTRSSCAFTGGRLRHKRMPRSKGAGLCPAAAKQGRYDCGRDGERGLRAVVLAFVEIARLLGHYVRNVGNGNQGLSLRLGEGEQRGSFHLDGMDV